MTAEILTNKLRLLEPFTLDKVKRRSQSGQNFDYVKGGDVIQRLIDATGNEYDWSLFSVDLQPAAGSAKYGYWIVRGSLTIPGLGTRSGIGTAQAMSEDAIKSAETDALKRAAVKFGVALQFYCEIDETLLGKFRDEDTQQSAQEPRTEAQASTYRPTPPAELYDPQNLPVAEREEAKPAREPEDAATKERRIWFAEQAGKIGAGFKEMGTAKKLRWLRALLPGWKIETIADMTGDLWALAGDPLARFADLAPEGFPVGDHEVIVDVANRECCRLDPVENIYQLNPIAWVAIGTYLSNRHQEAAAT